MAMPRSAGPVLDAQYGYVLAPMEQGIRLTTGVEFAARDALPTPVAVRPCVAGGKRPCFRSVSRSNRSLGSGRGHALPTRAR